jgi:hypothetical protein
MTTSVGTLIITAQGFPVRPSWIGANATISPVFSLLELNEPATQYSESIGTIIAYFNVQ